MTAVAASTTMLVRRRAGERAGALAWMALLLGLGASLAANVAAAQPTVQGRLVAAWPPVGLLLSYELLMQQIEARVVVASRPSAPVRPAPRMEVTVAARVHDRFEAAHLVVVVHDEDGQPRPAGTGPPSATGPRSYRLLRDRSGSSGGRARTCNNQLQRSIDGLADDLGSLRG